jgi:hypothetical protein
MLLMMMLFPCRRLTAAGYHRRAVAIEQQNPLWGDERIFQEARKWVLCGVMWC